jgi:hypothetical protein
MFSEHMSFADDGMADVNSRDLQNSRDFQQIWNQVCWGAILVATK